MITTEFSTSIRIFLFWKTEIETIVHVIAGKDFQTADLPAASHTPSSTGVHFYFR